MCTAVVSVALALTLPTASLIPAGAAQPQCGPNDVGPWWPRVVTSEGAKTLTAAERAAVERQLAAVETLVRKSPYATPRGFAVEPIFGFHEITDRTQLYSYMFTADTKHLCNKFDEYASHLIVTFNPSPMEWSAGDRPYRSERGEAFYLERPRRTAILGSTATFGAFHEEGTNTSAFFLLYTTADEPPTLPVSREEYLRFKIFEIEGKDAALKAAFKEFGDGYRAQIAAMSAQERASPAHLLGVDLVAPGTPYAYALVRKNAAFYKVRTSPFEPRAILVQMPNGHKDEWPQQEQLYKQFDWAALRKMVNP